jgi:hypothetical protein
MFNVWMIKSILIQFIIFSFLAQWCFSQNASDSEKLRGLVTEKGQAEVTIPNRGILEIDRLTRFVSISSVRDKEVRIILSPLTVEWFISEGYDYQIVERDETKGITTSLNISQAMEWESYPSYTQYDSIMRFFAASYPLLCVLDTIGTSINGRLILVLKISDNCRSDEPEPEVFYTSTMHGDETGGFILMLRLADHLLRNYTNDSRVKNIVDNLEIWINPLANPDGTYNGSNFIISPVRFNANGYDLNRNFPDPNTQYVIRQKETLDMMKFMAGHRFVLSANFHSGEEVVNYPWDRWPYKHADDEWFYSVCRAWADTAHLYSRKGYMDYLDHGVTNGYEWYPVYGGRQDYITYTLQGREITVELDTNYITPSSDLDDLWEYNRRSLLGYIENALYGIHGQVSDALTNEPVYAKISIKGHDKDNSHVYSDSLTGKFTRLLSPGSYNLTFTADGYWDTVIKNVTVASGEETKLSVKINPYLNPADTTNPVHPLFYPNPASTFVRAVLPENISGAVNIRIFNMTGLEVSEYYTEVSESNPVLLDVSRLPAGHYFVVFTGIGKDLSYSSRLVIVR